jgi:hypothetical protein
VGLRGGCGNVAWVQSGWVGDEGGDVDRFHGRDISYGSSG